MDQNAMNTTAPPPPAGWWRRRRSDSMYRQESHHQVSQMVGRLNLGEIGSYSQGGEGRRCRGDRLRNRHRVRCLPVFRLSGCAIDGSGMHGVFLQFWGVLSNEGARIRAAAAHGPLQILTQFRTLSTRPRGARADFHGFSSMRPRLAPRPSRVHQYSSRHLLQKDCDRSKVAQHVPQPAVPGIEPVKME